MALTGLVDFTRSRHCISQLFLVGEEHFLPDPEYRQKQDDRKRSHLAFQAESRRARNQGTEKRKKANRDPENKASPFF